MGKNLSNKVKETVKNNRGRNQSFEYAVYPKRAVSLGIGLPKRLCTYDNGIPRLRKMIGLNGEHLSWFLSFNMVKHVVKSAQMTGASKNEKLMFALTFPEIRLRLFQWAAKGLVEDGISHFPSPELSILKSFDGAFLDTFYDADKINSLPEIASIVADDADLNKRVAMLWLTLREKTAAWAELGTEARDEVINLAFALITLAQDVRAAEFAFTLEAELEEHLAFLAESPQLLNEQEDLDMIAVPIQEQHCATPEEMNGPAWDELMSRIADCALEAKGNISVEVVEALRGLIAGAEDLARAELEALRRKAEVNACFEAFAERIDRLIAQEDTSWLSESREEILEFWRTALSGEDADAARLEEIARQAELMACSLVGIISERDAMLAETRHLESSMSPRRLDLGLFNRIEELGKVAAEKFSAIVRTKHELYALLLPEGLDPQSSVALPTPGPVQQSLGSEGSPAPDDVAGSSIEDHETQSAVGTDPCETKVEKSETPGSLNDALHLSPPDPDKAPTAPPDDATLATVPSCGATFDHDCEIPIESDAVPTEDAAPASPVPLPAETATGEPCFADSENVIGATDKFSGGAAVCETAIIQRNLNEEKEPAITESTGETGDTGVTCVVVADSVEETVGCDLQAEPPSEAPEAEQVIWKLLARKQYSAAYHFARCYENQGVEPELTMEANLLAVVALAPQVRYDTGEIATVLKASFAELSNPDTLEARLLLAGAALRPALLAPSTNVGTFLRFKLGNDLDQFYGYCKAIADFTDFHHPLDPTALNRVKDKAVWQEELLALRNEAKSWMDHARYHNLIGPANRVWKKWLERGELVREALLPTIEDDRARIDETKKLVARLNMDSEVEREIDKTDNKLRNIRRAGDEITAKSLANLKHHLREVVAFLQRWLALTDTDPGKEKGFKHQQAEKIRSEIISHQDGVLDEINACIAGTAQEKTRVALEFCLNVVADLKELFTPDATLPIEEVPAHLLLKSDLLRLPCVSLDENWELGEECAATLLPALAKLPELSLRWRPAYDLHAKAGDHIATGRIVELLKRSGDPNGELPDIELARSTAVAKGRESLRKSVDSTRDRIEKAYAFGILTDPDFNRTALIAAVEVIENQLGTVLDFAAVEGKVADIDEQISAARNKKIEEAHNEMTKRGIDEVHPCYTRIRSILDSGDVLTVNEYIEMVQTGQELPTTDADADPFLAFFPQMANYLYDFLNNDSSLSSVITKVRNRNFTEIDMKNVPGAQAEQAASMLESWYRLKREEKVLGNTAQMENILKCLGFNSVKVLVDDRASAGHDRGRSRAQSHSWCNVTTDPLENKSICPVSVYGSGASGRYRILSVWGRPSEEEVAQLVGETCTIVFYFGCMTEQRRRGLAKLCRQEKKTFILVDDILMVYLCSVRGSRLQVMFKCALPFTHFQPYITTGGLVPVEMFYGRVSERNSIVSALESSASIIYGGRQLGKTALLKEAERSFTNYSSGQIALYIDLKGEAIEMDEIWSLLARKFRSLEVLEPGVNIHIDSKKLMVLIEQWLNALPERRIILLLDEADRFLESDAKEDFKRTSLLKNLMERTGRRFKVVFSGLHNVQRTARQNDPIAHFGDAICIGPLVERSEWREARALIEVPLAALGYYFDNKDNSLDLVTRILSQTNYYPSLIQLYCKQLLDHLTEHAVRGGGKVGLPYRISARQVDDAYRNQELQKAIRHRFMLTLRLDPRYELIAYAIAWGFLNNGRNMTDGYPLGWIRDQALSWWEPGFRNCSDFESFRALVDEMVGLGVLRHTSRDQYTFRSLNVISLMGDQDTIEDALQTQRELPSEYQPSIFRKTVKVRGQAKCSPLTAREISHLKSRENGVVVITGSRASGLEEVQTFIADTFQEGYFENLDSVLDQVSFSKKLDEIVGTRKKDGTTIYFVNHSIPWSEQWVTSAQTKLNKLKSPESFAKVVFVADHKLSYTLLDSAIKLLGENDAEGLTVMSLKPWHSSVVKQWLEDSSLGPVDGQIDRIEAVTGNWPALMYEFQAHTKNLYQWSHSLEDLKKTLVNPGESCRFREMFGVEGHPVSTVFSALAILNDDLPTSDDLCASIEGISQDEVDKVIRWGYLLGYLSPQGRDGWRINNVIGDLFKQDDA